MRPRAVHDAKTAQKQRPSAKPVYPRQPTTSQAQLICHGRRPGSERMGRGAEPFSARWWSSWSGSPTQQCTPAAMCLPQCLPTWHLYAISTPWQKQKQKNIPFVFCERWPYMEKWYMYSNNINFQSVEPWLAGFSKYISFQALTKIIAPRPLRALQFIRSFASRPIEAGS